MRSLPAMLAPALRGLARRPLATSLSVLMLALGIGAGTAVFSIMAPVLLRPMGISDRDRVVEVCRRMEGEMDGSTFSFSQGLPDAELKAQRAVNPCLAALAKASTHHLVVRVEGQEARCLQGAVVTAPYFQVMGTAPWLGRTFTAAEDQVAEPAVLLSHALWLNLFGGDASAVGQTLHLNSQPCRVVGVLPRGFVGHEVGQRTDLWIPQGAKAQLLPFDPAMNAALSSSPSSLARLRPGTSLAQAEAAFRAIGAGFQASATPPGMQAEPITLRPFAAERNQVLEERLPAPWLMLGVAASLLLLACANVANLQLAQLESRRAEFATRLSLGASRFTIARGVLAENLLLCVLAGLLGLSLAVPFMRGLEAIRDVKVFEMPLAASLSPEACAFALLLALLATFAVGLLPALQASRVGLAQVLKETAGTLARGNRLKDALVAFQVALALVLVTAGTLVARGLDRARATGLGYRTTGVAGARLAFPEAWPASRRAEAILALRERVATLPGVKSVAWAEGLPMEENGLTITIVQGKPLRLLAVGPGYFSTLGLPLVQGQEFREADLGGSGRVVNQAFAQRLWPGQEAVGRAFNERSVLGVVVDHALSADKGPHEPVAFRPLKAEGGACLLFRTEGSPEPLFPAIRQLLRGIDPDLPLLQLTTLEAHFDRLHHHLRVASWLLGFCGIASLVLSAMGVQSLLVFRVTRQSRDIGLRMALGAQRGFIVRHVVRQGLGSVALGLALGTLGAFWTGRAFHHLFTGVSPFEPGSLLRALLVLVPASLLACLIPALRAASLDPARALRQD